MIELFLQTMYNKKKKKKKKKNKKERERTCFELYKISCSIFLGP